MSNRTTLELQAAREKHVPRGPFNMTPLFARKAKGAVIEDLDGKRYIDFAGGIGVQNVGHCASRVVSAIQQQAEEFIHTCFHVAMYEPYIDLAARLNAVTPGDFHKKTFFVNSGAEAVENGVKIARYATKKSAIITFENAFHGRTYMALSLTSQVKPYKWGFGPFLSEIYRMPYAYCYRCSFGLSYPGCNLHCANAMEDLFIRQVSADAVAAVIIEPVQGEGGFIVPPVGYLQRIKAICERNGIILIVDEIQTGMGRTGKLYACEHFDVVPDIILSGKSLAAGLPLAAVTGKAEIMDAPHAGGMGGTYGGNPLACRAGLVVLDMLAEEDSLRKARALGERVKFFFQSLQGKYSLVGDVRSLGAMVAMELVKDRASKTPATDETKEIVRRCYEKGLIALSCGVYHNVIRTLIPFAIEERDLETGLSIIEQSLQATASA